MGELPCTGVEHPVVTEAGHGRHQTGHQPQDSLIGRERGPQHRPAARLLLLQLEASRAAHVARQGGGHKGWCHHLVEDDGEAQGVGQGRLDGAPPHRTRRQLRPVEAPEPGPPAGELADPADGVPHHLPVGLEVEVAGGRELHPSQVGTRRAPPISPEAEPDAARLGELTDDIKAKGITTVFYEDLVSPKVAETLARESGVRTAVLSPIEGLSKEDLDAGKDYADVMRDNLAALRDALGCT